MTANHWTIKNGGGWNHHVTADRLNQLIAEGDDRITDAPEGYRVLVAPISDGPIGLRCALVRVLPRMLAPVVDWHVSCGNYIYGEELGQLTRALPDDDSIENLRAHLASISFTQTHERPAGWPEGREWFHHADGRWASIEMLDDGCDGEEDGWVRDHFGFDGEVVKAVRVDQQSEDSSAWFAKKMSEAIDDLVRR